MPKRIEPARTDAVVSLDGDEVPARRGEPLAVAIAAAGRLTTSRSVKYHRPRGAYCMQGRCDGCLMRVDGVGNVMTCQTPAENGMNVQSQNFAGSVETDLLGLTDWLFPTGLDHHHLMTTFRPTNEVMQRIARRIAGIAKLPDAVARSPLPETSTPDLLIVGAGLAGLTAGQSARAYGLDTLVVEESDRVGGRRAWTQSSSTVGPTAKNSWAVGPGSEACGGVALRHTALAVFGDAVIVCAPNRLLVVRPKRLVVAGGQHETPGAVSGGDIPGVWSTHAALTLLRHGVLVGEDTVLAGDGERIDYLEQQLLLEGARVFRTGGDALLEVEGRTHVEAARLSSRFGPRLVPCDAIVTEGIPSAEYELGSQAGAATRFDGRSFVVQASPYDGATGETFVRAIGACSGVEDSDLVVAQAQLAAKAIARELGRDV